MRGVAERRGHNLWRVRVFAGREDGRTRWVSRTIAGTKRQAETALAKLVTEVENDQVAKHQPGTLADLLHQWLETVAAERSPYTMREYRRMAVTNIERSAAPSSGAWSPRTPSSNGKANRKRTSGW